MFVLVEIEISAPKLISNEPHLCVLAHENACRAFTYKLLTRIEDLEGVGRELPRVAVEQVGALLVPRVRGNVHAALG